MLRDRHEYLHATYADKILTLPKSKQLEEMGRLPTPLYRATEASNMFKAFENRLLRARQVATLTEAQREIDLKIYFTSSLMDPWRETSLTNAIKKQTASELRGKYDMTLSGNTALRRLLERTASGEDVTSLVAEGFRLTSGGVTQFRNWDAKWLHHGGKTEIYTIDDLERSEDIFVRSEVSAEDTLRVPNLTLTPVFRSGAKTVVTRAGVGLYQISTTQKEWTENLLSRLLSARQENNAPISPEKLTSIFNQDREWVNDDTGIISQCLADTAHTKSRGVSVLLISSDKRLANQLSQTCNVFTYMVDPEYALVYYGDTLCWSSQVKITWEEAKNFISSTFIQTMKYQPSAVYIDYGSVASRASRLQAEEREDDEPQKIFRRFTIETGFDKTTKTRFSHYQLQQVGVGMQKAIPLTYKPIARPGTRRASATRPFYPNTSHT